MAGHPDRVGIEEGRRLLAGMKQKGKGGKTSFTAASLPSVPIKKKLTGNMTAEEFREAMKPPTAPPGLPGVFIPYEVRSSKNSKQWMGVMSKAAIEYKKISAQYWIDATPHFRKLLEGKQAPYKVEFTFIRSTHQPFDYINMAQLPQDLMQKYEWLTDDNFHWMKPSFGDVLFMPEHYGVLINVL